MYVFLYIYLCAYLSPLYLKNKNGRRRMWLYIPTFYEPNWSIAEAVINHTPPVVVLFLLEFIVHCGLKILLWSLRWLLCSWDLFSSYRAISYRAVVICVTCFSSWLFALPYYYRSLLFCLVLFYIGAVVWYYVVFWLVLTLSVSYASSYSIGMLIHVHLSVYIS